MRPGGKQTTDRCRAAGPELSRRRATCPRHCRAVPWGRQEAVSQVPLPWLWRPSLSPGRVRGDLHRGCAVGQAGGGRAGTLVPVQENGLGTEWTQ